MGVLPPLPPLFFLCSLLLSLRFTLDTVFPEEPSVVRCPFLAVHQPLPTPTPESSAWLGSGTNRIPMCISLLVPHPAGGSDPSLGPSHSQPGPAHHPPDTACPSPVTAPSLRSPFKDLHMSSGSKPAGPSRGGGPSLLSSRGAGCKLPMGVLLLHSGPQVASQVPLWQAHIPATTFMPGQTTPE